MFFGNSAQLEAELKAQKQENESLRQEIEELTQKNSELQQEVRDADSNKVMNELIKSLTHGLTDGCDRD
ncbi:MAG: chemotaxis protein, partial [Campylobacterota bacterium]|nr:chemotaxis protein [Campylobacterota bacterium]